MAYKKLEIRFSHTFKIFSYSILAIHVIVVSMYCIIGAMFVRMSDVQMSVYCIVFEKMSVKKLENIYSFFRKQHLVSTFIMPLEN